jgi:hypothetical protein
MATDAAVMVYLPLGVSGIVHEYTTSTSTAEALPTATRLILSNTGAGICHYIVGASNVGAAVVATCEPIMATSQVVFDVPNGPRTDLYIRVIGATTTGNLHISRVG